MAAIAQSDQFHVFMRKIGYSAGLENTFARLIDLTEVYVKNRQVTMADWQNLVSEKWGLKNDHIGDVFGSLGVIHRSRKGIDIGPTLDMLGILRIEYKDDSAKFLEAAKFIFILVIIEFDGEIFLNTLAVEFDGPSVISSLQRLIEYKRGVLFGIYRDPGLQHKIAQIVNIDRQFTNKGSSGGQKKLGDMKRTEPLSSLNRTEALSSRPSREVVISEDYLRKHPPKRREWAKTLGFVDSDGKLTTSGHQFLDAFRRAGCSLDTGEFVLWPFAHEIRRLQLNPTFFQGLAVEYWRLVHVVSEGMGLACAAGSPTEEEKELIVARLRSQFSDYRSLDLPKAILRRELPLTIAYATTAAASFAEDKHLMPVAEVVEDMRLNNDSRIEIRSSRNSIGTLVFRG